MNTTAIRELGNALDYIKRNCAEWRVFAHAETFTRMEAHENDQGAQVLRPVEYIRISMRQEKKDKSRYEAPTCPDMLIHESQQWAIMHYTKAMVMFLNSYTPPTPEEWMEKESAFVPASDLFF